MIKRERYILPPDGTPVIMGILNVTPDSFSDGGMYAESNAAVKHAGAMLEAGADIIDIGGESTRPGFHGVDAETELERVLPVIRAVRDAYPNVKISVDTTKAAVARAAADEGAAIINDVSGLADPNMAEVVNSYGLIYVLMHGYAEHTGLARKPNPMPSGIAGWVASECAKLLEKTERAGINRNSIWLDPGFGFGKKNLENLEVLNGIPRLLSFGLPLLIGISRKHFVKEAAGMDDLDEASVFLASRALNLGGKIFRVHNVSKTCAGLRF